MRFPAEPLPKSLAEALAALKDSACFRAGFGDVFVDYHLAHQERPRSRAATRRASGQAGNMADVTAWEHKEYFDLA